jgi:uncharacterized protein (TIRG00374 family)
MAKRYLFTAIIFVIWVAGFYLATGGFSGEDLISVLSNVSPYAVLIALMSYVLATGMGMYALYRCLNYVGLKPPRKGIAKAWIFGSFIDNIMPTITPLGEAAMAYFLEKFYRVSYTKSLAAIGIYVSSWAISVSIFATLAVLVVQYFVGVPSEFVIPVILVISFFILVTVGWLLLLTRKKLINKIVCKFMVLYRIITNKIKKKKVTIEECIVEMEFEKSYESLKLVMKNKKHILNNVFILAIPQIAHILCIYALMLGFGIDVSFFSVMMVHIVSTVMGLLFLIPSGLGVYEGTSIGGLVGILGIDPTAAFGAIFLYRVIFVWGTNLMGGLIGIIQGVEDIKVKT